MHPRRGIQGSLQCVDARGLRSRGWTAVAGSLLAVAFVVGCTLQEHPGPERPVPAVFQLTAPQATRVSVVGTFNGWDPHATPLEGPDRNGVWSLRLLLPPGRYRYMFVLDGSRWVTDPAGVAFEDDGFGGRNSLLFHGR